MSAAAAASIASASVVTARVGRCSMCRECRDASSYDVSYDVSSGARHGESMSGSDAAESSAVSGGSHWPLAEYAKLEPGSVLGALGERIGERPYAPGDGGAMSVLGAPGARSGRLSERGTAAPGAGAWGERSGGVRTRGGLCTPRWSYLRGGGRIVAGAGAAHGTEWWRAVLDGDVGTTFSVVQARVGTGGTRRSCLACSAWEYGGVYVPGGAVRCPGWSSGGTVPDAERGASTCEVDVVRTGVATRTGLAVRIEEPGVPGVVGGGPCPTLPYLGMSSE